jgi:hypothetical protein
LPCADCKLTKPGSGWETCVETLSHLRFNATIVYYIDMRVKTNKQEAEATKCRCAGAQQKAAAKPEAPHVEPPPDAHPAVNDSSGAVAVSTIPDGADISVDGNFVGSAPATLKLAPGKHVISVSQHGFKAWSRELSVLPGSEVTLKAELEKD